MPVDAIIFDVDGTVAETDEFQRIAINLALRDKDLDWHLSHGNYARYAACPTIAGKLRGYVADYRAGDLARLSETGLLDALVARAQRHFTNLIEDGSVGLRPGVARLIKEARNAGVKLALCSLGPVSSFEVILQHQFGLSALDIFDVVTTRETLDPDTDAADAYRDTIRRLATEPGRTFAIENSGDGARAARSTGLNVLAIPSLYTTSDNFDAAQIVLSDLGHPAAPFSALQGRVGPYNFVNLDALETWSSDLAAVA